MYSKEMLNSYIKTAAYINGNYGAITLTIHFILIILLIIFLERAFANPGKKTTVALSLLFWAVQIFGGFFFLLGREKLGPLKAWMSLFGSVLLGGLFALPAFISKHRFRLSPYPVHRIVGILFMVAGAALYPLVEILTGMHYPGIVLIGAECPSYIFFIGLLIACLPNVNKILTGILLLYGLISSVSAVYAGALVDIIYISAAGSGIILFIHSILTSKHQNHPTEGKA